jgi:hypothetical protein
MPNTVRRKLLHLLRIFLVGVGLAVVLSFLAAIGASKLYWGYFIRRPGVDRRIGEIEQVISLTSVRSERQSDGSVRFVASNTYRIADGLSVCRDERPWISYYCLDERILVALDDLGKLPASPDHMSPDELAALYGQLEATQLLYDGAPGYHDHATDLRGIVLVAKGKSDQHYLFVGVTGGQVSNDHHPYYEFLFDLPDHDSELVLLSCNRFFYDVAGVEGLDGLAVWPVFFLAGMVIVVLVGALLSVISILREKRRPDVSELQQPVSRP